MKWTIILVLDYLRATLHIESYLTEKLLIMDEYFSSILGTLPEMKTKEPEVFIPIIPLWLIYILACIPLLWCIIYYISNLLMSLLGPVDMKKKYNAKWALVTGGGR